jgi:hypothetical protein
MLYPHSVIDSYGVNRFAITVHPLESDVDFSPGYTEQAGARLAAAFQSAIVSRTRKRRFRAGVMPGLLWEV